MTAADLAAALRGAGLVVEEYPGWETRGGAWEFGTPVGLMEHHTALPVPFPVDNLAGVTTGLIKCNANVKPDGTVWLIAYKACNYSSGGGMAQVRAEVLASTPPAANAVERGWNPDGSDDNDNGNDLFWNFENDHPGSGGPMPTSQHEAIVAASVVVAEHFGLSWANTIGHAEWTARKSDPYWNADRRCIETIRKDMEEQMPTVEEIWAYFEANPVEVKLDPAANPQPNGAYLKETLLLASMSGTASTGSMKQRLTDIETGVTGNAATLAQIQVTLAEIQTIVTSIDSGDTTAIAAGVDQANAHLVAIRTALGSAAI